MGFAQKKLRFQKPGWEEGATALSDPRHVRLSLVSRISLFLPCRRSQKSGAKCLTWRIKRKLGRVETNYLTLWNPWRAPLTFRTLRRRCSWQTQVLNLILNSFTLSIASTRLHLFSHICNQNIPIQTYYWLKVSKKSQCFYSLS